MQRAMISSDHETCSATTSEDEDEEIRSRVPHVTITRNPSRVSHEFLSSDELLSGELNLPNMSYVALRSFRYSLSLLVGVVSSTR